MLFASDLDNTLLFSVSHRQEGDRCVEWLDGNEQGFMTPETISLLETVHGLTRLIPVTTRSVAQYLRIRFPVTPDYAVAANGAVLLHERLSLREYVGCILMFGAIVLAQLPARNQQAQ